MRKKNYFVLFNQLILFNNQIAVVIKERTSKPMKNKSDCQRVQNGVERFIFF